MEYVTLSESMSNPLTRIIGRAVDARENELAALIWSAAYFFFVLSAYYVLRPIRDEAGVAGGVDNLAWLFTGTLVGMLLVHPLFAGLVARLPRRRFVPLTYRFFILHLIGFFLLYTFVDPSKSVWIGRVFFVWASIFNLFVVSVFWSFMTDIYRPGQSKRLFGMVAVGGSIGAITGSTITSALAAPAYAGITWEVLDWEARDGLVVPIEAGPQPLVYVPADTPGTLASGDVVLHSARTMYDDGVMMRHTPSLHRLARGPAAHLHPDDARRIGTAEGRRVRLTGRHVEADLDVVLDDTLSRGVVYVPFNQPGGPALGSDPIVRVTAVG